MSTYLVRQNIRRPWRLVPLTPALALSCLFVMPLVACGSDDAPPPDAMPDAILDATPDAPPPDATPDATPDGGPDCTGAEDGMPCSEEGVICGGPCTDPCSFCNLLSCQGGVWVRMEAFPAPCFDCGPTRCVLGGQYCDVSYSDVGGEEDVYACNDIPMSCGMDQTCDCLEMELSFDRCMGDASEGLTIEHFGG